MTVYPGLSLVRNTGFGADATHCGKGGISRVFRRQKVNSRVPHVDWNALPLEEDPDFSVPWRHSTTGRTGSGVVLHGGRYGGQGGGV